MGEFMIRLAGFTVIVSMLINFCPHFEKMLYDNALLLESFVRGYLLKEEPLYRSIIEETIDWLDSDLLLNCGLYASALDADVDGEEGSPMFGNQK